jgi:hypothetical protein
VHAGGRTKQQASVVKGAAALFCLDFLFLFDQTKRLKD